MRQLLLLTSGELTRDPRARRAAEAAVALGWRVTGVCLADGEPPAPLPGVDVCRAPAAGAIDRRLRSTIRPHVRRSVLAREARGAYRLLRIARANVALLRAARRLPAIDVVHANDFDTLPAGWLLRRRFRGRLVYDAHELYTEQEPDPPMLYTHLVRVAERALSRRADAVVTVSEPIATELQQLLGLSRRPLVVLNCPARSTTASSPEVATPLRVVYQGAVSLARHPADLLDALESAHGVHLTLRLVGLDLEELRKLVAARGLEGRVSVAPPVDPTALLDALVPYDVGVIATRPSSRNDELAVPNKLFEYMMAGLAVVAPRLPGILPFVEGENVGRTFDPGVSASLAAALTAMAADPANVSNWKRRSRDVALAHYNAEAQRASLEQAWTR